MRIIKFDDYIILKNLQAAFDNKASHSMHKRRQAYSAFILHQPWLARCGLEHACRYLRKKEKDDVADKATRTYNAFRRGNYSAEETVTYIDGYHINDKGPVLMINEALDALGQEEKGQETAYAQAAGGNTITHKDLPTFDTPRGFMSPQAWGAVGDGYDAAAVALIFQGNNQGEHSAPTDGFTHVHVNRNAQRCMSYDLDRKRIIAFTAHMDNSGPGQTQAARATRALAEANRLGWVWVAIINNGFYRITAV
jgi:hypothetical protein